MRALFLVGRTIFGGYFAYNGINHFLNGKMLSQYARSKGVTQPELAVTASGGMLLAGAASVLAGFKPREGLAALVAFLVPVTLTMHRFWDTTEPSEQMNETINFTKNMALAGAALMLMQIAEPWPASLDGAFAPDEDMYVRIANRDMLQLPA